LYVYKIAHRHHKHWLSNGGQVMACVYFILYSFCSTCYNSCSVLMNTCDV